MPLIHYVVQQYDPARGWAPVQTHLAFDVVQQQWVQDGGVACYLYSDQADRAIMNLRAFYRARGSDFPLEYFRVRPFLEQDRLPPGMANPGHMGSAGSGGSAF